MFACFAAGQSRLLLVSCHFRRGQHAPRSSIIPFTCPSSSRTCHWRFFFFFFLLGCVHYCLLPGLRPKEHLGNQHRLLRTTRQGGQTRGNLLLLLLDANRTELLGEGGRGARGKMGQYMKLRRCHISQRAPHDTSLPLSELSILRVSMSQVLFCKSFTASVAGGKQMIRKGFETMISCAAAATEYYQGAP